MSKKIVFVLLFVIQVLVTSVIVAGILISFTEILSDRQFLTMCLVIGFLYTKIDYVLEDLKGLKENRDAYRL